MVLEECIVCVFKALTVLYAGVMSIMQQILHLCCVEYQVYYYIPLECNIPLGLQPREILHSEGGNKP